MSTPYYVAPFSHNPPPPPPSSCSTPYYVAPEVVSNGMLTKNSDVSFLGYKNCSMLAGGG